MNRILLAVALVMALPSVISAQSQPLAYNEVLVNQQFYVVIDHTGADTTHYRLKRNGVTVVEMTKETILSGSVVTFQPRYESTAGTYTYTVTAVNNNGLEVLESDPSPAFSLVVKNSGLVKPATPSMPRIIRLP